MKFIFHKMPIADCGCCYKRPSWIRRFFGLWHGRYLIGVVLFKSEVDKPNE